MEKLFPRKVDNVSQGLQLVDPEISVQIKMLIAAKYGLVEVLQYLIETTKRENIDNGPLDIAAATDQIEVIKFLLANHYYNNLETAVRYAISRNNLPIIQLFEAHGYIIYINLLEFAAQWANVNTMKYLLDIISPPPEDVADIIVSSGTLDMIKLLQPLLLPESIAEAQELIFREAAINNKADIIRYLLPEMSVAYLKYGDRIAAGEGYLELLKIIWAYLLENINQYLPSYHSQGRITTVKQLKNHYQSMFITEAIKGNELEVLKYFEEFVTNISSSAFIRNLWQSIYVHGSIATIEYFVQVSPLFKKYFIDDFQPAYKIISHNNYDKVALFGYLLQFSQEQQLFFDIDHYLREIVYNSPHNFVADFIARYPQYLEYGEELRRLQLVY